MIEGGEGRDPLAEEPSADNRRTWEGPTYTEAKRAAQNAEAKRILDERVAETGLDPNRQPPWELWEVEAIARGLAPHPGKTSAATSGAETGSEEARRRHEQQAADNQAAAEADAAAAREFDDATERASRTVVGRSLPRDVPAEGPSANPFKRSGVTEGQAPTGFEVWQRRRPYLDARPRPERVEQATRDAETDTNTQEAEQASDQA